MDTESVKHSLGSPPHFHNQFLGVPCSLWGVTNTRWFGKMPAVFLRSESLSKACFDCCLVPAGR